MSGDSELLAPTTQEQTPPAQDAAPPVVPPAEEEPEVLEIPTGEKLVPLSALTGAREALKAAKAERDALKADASKSAEKDARIAELTQAIQQLQPKAQAYDAAVDAQSRQPQKPAEQTPEEKAELEEIARDLDFYKGDGSLDLDRAQRFQAREQKRAERIAAATVAPFEQMNTAQQSNYMLQRALLTKAPDGSQPDPEVLRTVWERLDRRVTSTPEGAAQAFSVALGHSALLGKLKGGKAATTTTETIPPPLETERAGGKETPSEISLSDQDRRAARDMGMTDKQYIEELKQMPKGWGKHA